MNLPLQIRALRQAGGWTQVQLAQRTGIAQPNLAAFESGTRRPSVGTLGRLSQGLGVDVGRLLRSEPPLVLDRFAMDALARTLMAGGPPPKGLPPKLWQDLQAVYCSKLSALAPQVTRRRPRLSPYAAERRALAQLGSAAFAELTRRFEKAYPQAGA